MVPVSAEPQSVGFRFLREAQQTGEWPWFEEHYRQAPQEVMDFLTPEGLSLEGKQVADIGCGDGIIDLGLVDLAKPERLVGFDLEPTDTDALLADARRAGVVDERLPEALEFRTNSLTGLPARDGEFDVLVSWSTFEHVSESVGLLREMRRIVHDDGMLFLQIWPLYFSQHGSHLWPWYPDGYAQFENTDEELEAHIRSAELGREEDVEFILSEYRSLNRMTVDKLQRALLAAGWYVAKFELMTGATRVTPTMARYPMSDLGIAGIKLIAVTG
jgi:ubiquinone/menaquinone biosynthesis C-methylase UbiE